MRLNGEEHEQTVIAANNYALALSALKRFEEVRALFRKTVPVARRVFGESNETTLKMRTIYAEALYKDPAAALHDLREAVTTLAEIEPIARRVLGGTHPVAMNIEASLQNARSKLASFDALSERMRDLSVS